MEVHHEEVVETSEHCSSSFSKKVSELQKFKFNTKLAKLGEHSGQSLKPRVLRQILANSSDILMLSTVLRKDPSLGKIAESLMEESLAPGTMSSYAGPIEDFKMFCQEQHYKLGFSSKILVHYITSLAKREISYSYVCRVMPALKLLADSLDKPLIITDYIQRLMKGLKRRTSRLREPAKKAAELPLDTIKFLVKKELVVYASNIQLINPIVLRTLCRTTVEYFLHCRFNDFAQLEARHFRLTDAGIEVTFPRGKTDQLHNGSSSVLVANGSDFCPVWIVSTYFRRAGFSFSNIREDFSKVNCQIRKSGGSWIFQNHKKLGRTTAIEQLQQLLRKWGFPSIGVTDKSAKSEGVTRSLEAGASLEEVQLHGRWKTLDIPMRYKRNSVEFKAKIAQNVPY